jgi:hypothetical protein
MATYFRLQGMRAPLRTRAMLLSLLGNMALLLYAPKGVKTVPDQQAASGEKTP